MEVIKGNIVNLEFHPIIAWEMDDFGYFSPLTLHKSSIDVREEDRYAADRFLKVLVRDGLVYEMRQGFPLGSLKLFLDEYKAKGLELVSGSGIPKQFQAITEQIFGASINRGVQTP